MHDVTSTATACASATDVATTGGLEAADAFETPPAPADGERAGPAPSPTAFESERLADSECARLRRREEDYERGLARSHARRGSFDEALLESTARMARSAKAGMRLGRGDGGRGEATQLESRLATATTQWVRHKTEQLQRRLSTGSSAESMAAALAAYGPAYVRGAGHARAWVDVSDKTLTALVEGALPPSESKTRPMFGKGSLAPHPLRTAGSKRREEDDATEIAEAIASGAFVGASASPSAGASAARRLHSQAAALRERRDMLAVLATPQFPFRPEIDPKSRAMAARPATAGAADAYATLASTGLGASQPRFVALYESARVKADAKAAATLRGGGAGGGGGDPSLTFRPHIDPNSRAIAARLYAKLEAQQAQAQAQAEQTQAQQGPKGRPGGSGGAGAS